MGRERSGRQRVRLFRNDILERLTLTTPMTLVLSWSVFLAFALADSWNAAGPLVSIGLLMLGLLIWTLFEYAMHRYLFHFETSSTFGRWLIFLAHGNHHAAPNDPHRNIMPPLVSIAIAGSVWALLRLLWGQQGSVIFVGFGIGYVIYDAVHYACHQLPMRTPMLRALRQHHLRHHYGKRDGNYAITAIFWDWVFGTAVPLKAGTVRATHSGSSRRKS